MAIGGPESLGDGDCRRARRSVQHMGGGPTVAAGLASPAVDSASDFVRQSANAVGEQL